MSPPRSSTIHFTIGIPSPKPEARTVPRLVGPVEPLKNMIQFFRLHANAVVGYRKGTSRFGCCRPYRHFAAHHPILDAVANQIDEQLGQQALVSENRAALRHLV